MNDQNTRGQDEALPELSREELARYERHLRLPEIGLKGQQRLKQARVVIVGAGGLGCPAALYLAAAGVGRIRLVDPDVVDASNLQRQVLYTQQDIGQPKVARARARLLALNPAIDVDAQQSRLNPSNGLDLIADGDLVLDGTDNFATRYLLNDLCIAQDKALISGSLHRFEGQVSVFHASRGPCYRCLFPAPPPSYLVPNCAEAGVLGVLPGLVGALQASEAVKQILDLGEGLIGRLVTLDLLAMTTEEFKIPKDPRCLSCGAHREAMDEAKLSALFEACKVGEFAEGEWELTPEELQARLAQGDEIVLVDVRETWELQLTRLEGALSIPLPELSGRLDELTRKAEIVVLCKIGERSAWAVRQMRAAGFSRVFNLSGGLVAWASRIDPGVAGPPPRD